MKMGWFILAIGAMISFTLMFLINKKILDLGVKSYLLYMYLALFGALIAFLYIVGAKEGFSISKWAIILLVVAAVFSFLGNVFLLNSINISSNPGYPLAVSGVHILLVAVISIFVFKSEFTLTKGIGVILAVLGIILLGWD